MSGLDYWLPVAFLVIMGIAMLAYVVLDGYDLGVGMLLPRADAADKDTMVACIGPYWDANETWLVLGVGLLLIAFPKAHGVVLTALYLPVALMLIGLILRGVAFDFRVKGRDSFKPLWNRIFFAGSTLAAAAQGWMLGQFVTGLEGGWGKSLFAATIALLLPAAYVLMGTCWLLIKTDGELQKRALGWARIAWPPVVLGLVLISIATPLVSDTIRAKWFALPQFFLLAPIPLLCAIALLALRQILHSPRVLHDLCWIPFALLVLVFLCGALGLGYSLFPYVVMDRLTVWQAASATESLVVILIGAAVAVPAIAGYTVFSYRVFRGKASGLHYA
jgi:cytochrome d ubiquinol oxidase subunit II